MKAHAPIVAGLALSLAALASCQSMDRGPVLEEVEPSSVPFGLRDAGVRLRGVFPPRVELSLGGAGADVSDEFQVQVGAVSAPSVLFVDETELFVVLPEGLPARRHDVTVTGPSGGQSTLEEGLQVAAGRVSRVDFAAPPPLAPGALGGPIDVELRDQNGNPAPGGEGVEVTVSVSPVSGGVSLLPEGPFSPTVTQTISGDESSFPVYFQATAAEYYQMTAAIPGALPTTRTILVGNFGAPKKLRFASPPANVLAGTPVQLEVRVLDDSDGPATLPPGGFVVTFVHDADGGAGGFSTGRSDPPQPSLGVVVQSGSAFVYYRDTTAAPRTITAEGGQVADDSILLPVLPGPVSGFDAGVPPCVVDGRAFTATFTARDVYGNLIRDYPGPVALTLEKSGSVSPSSTGGFDGGSVTLQLTTSGAGNHFSCTTSPILRIRDPARGANTGVCLLAQSALFCP